MGILWIAAVFIFSGWEAIDAHAKARSAFLTAEDLYHKNCVSSRDPTGKCHKLRSWKVRTEFSADYAKKRLSFVLIYTFLPPVILLVLGFAGFWVAQGSGKEAVEAEPK